MAIVETIKLDTTLAEEAIDRLEARIDDLSERLHHLLDLVAQLEEDV